jgi:hypothetical protein
MCTRQLQRPLPATPQLTSAWIVSGQCSKRTGLQQSMCQLMSESQRRTAHLNVVYGDPVEPSVSPTALRQQPPTLSGRLPLPSNVELLLTINHHRA